MHTTNTTMAQKKKKKVKKVNKIYILKLQQRILGNDLLKRKNNNSKLKDFWQFI